MIKSTQKFGWEHEPVAERPSEFMPSRFSGSSVFAGLEGFDPTLRAAAACAAKDLPVAAQAQRSRPNDIDRNLSRLVPRWLESLPAGSRPHHLCANFPRIANRLALCWAEPALAVQVLDDFFRDKRGTRRGFPPEARNELTSLRELASLRLTRKGP